MWFITLIWCIVTVLSLETFEKRSFSSEEDQSFLFYPFKHTSRQSAISGNIRPINHDGRQIFEKSIFDRNVTLNKVKSSEPQPTLTRLPPKLQLVGIETYCFNNSKFVSFGSCSSTYLKCSWVNRQIQYYIEECPLGQVFQKTRCGPAYEVKDCYNLEANLLNDATEKLAKKTNFCYRNSLGTSLYSASQSGSANYQCSRQALLCRNNGDPLAISCSSNYVLDIQTLQCIPAPEKCFFVSNGDFAPIRENLLHFYCAFEFPESLIGDSSSFISQVQLTNSDKSTNSNLQCQNWYVACLAPKLEIIFCDNRKLFDGKRKTCRRVTTEDQCPLISACKGWEWRSVSLGECRNDFIYCNGLRPTTFQCQAYGAVFKDEKCVLPDKLNNQCDVCKLGSYKKGEKCNEFYICEKHTLTKKPSWEVYRCDAPRVFSRFTKECVQPNEYNCPNKIDCIKGNSFSVNCGDFYYCYEGKYLLGKCPLMTRWESTEKRCIADPVCHRQIENKKNKTVCENGEAKPSVDCKTFKECNQGVFVTKSCSDTLFGPLKAPCRFCHFAINKMNTYSIDKLLPINFKPFDGQGVRQKLCDDGEKIVNTKDCERYMECVNGEWYNLVCPKKYFFDSNTQSCVKGSQKQCKEVRKNMEDSAVFLKPLYLLNETFTDFNLENGAGPIPNISELYKKNYEDSLKFCDLNSSAKLPHPHDCSKYKECILDSGGYYIEKQCPSGSQFDAIAKMCKYDYLCVAPKCVEGIREPRNQCGKLRRCMNGIWENVHCKSQMAFVNGRCSKTISCNSANKEFPHGGQCIHQHAKPHYYDCTKYLLCSYGQYVEETCFNGHQFNPEISRCDPSYKCKSKYRSDCYENEMRALANNKTEKNFLQLCNQYEICVDAKFQKQRCPYGQYFDGKAKRCIDGNCSEKSNLKKTTVKVKNYNNKCNESAGVDGFRPDELNCNKFYQCANGVWIVKNCAANLAFNPALGVCDWSSNVPGC